MCAFLFTVVQLREHQKVSASLEESVVVCEEQNSLTMSKRKYFIIIDYTQLVFSDSNRKWLTDN